MPIYIDFDMFTGLMRVAPKTMGRLLLAIGLEPTQHLRNSLCSYYNAMTYLDSHEYDDNGELPQVRQQELCQKAGLDPALSDLPFQLYRLYRQQIANAEGSPEGWQLTEEEIIYQIAGCSPIDKFFAVDNLVCCWDEEAGSYGIFSYEDNMDIKRICIDYLRSKGRWYADCSDVYKAAVMEKWPGWEKIERDV